MNKFIYIFTIAGLIILWLLNRGRLQAYNDCYMSRYENWDTDCELGYNPLYE